MQSCLLSVYSSICSEREMKSQFLPRKQLKCNWRDEYKHRQLGNRVAVTTALSTQTINGYVVQNWPFVLKWKGQRNLRAPEGHSHSSGLQDLMSQLHHSGTSVSGLSPQQSARAWKPEYGTQAHGTSCQKLRSLIYTRDYLFPRWQLY